VAAGSIFTLFGRSTATQPGDALHDVLQGNGNSNTFSGYVFGGDMYEKHVAIGGQLEHV
jgi:hypothetical protein